MPVCRKYKSYRLNVHNINSHPHDSVMKEKAAALGERISSVSFFIITYNEFLVSDLFL